eukprot:5729123-Pleurochrysis_carterae.AAC.2
MASHEQAQQVETPAHHPQGTSYKCHAIVIEGKRFSKAGDAGTPRGGFLWGTRLATSTRQSRKRAE